MQDTDNLRVGYLAVYSYVMDLENILAGMRVLLSN